MGSSKHRGAWLAASGALMALACGGEEATTGTGTGGSGAGAGAGGSGGTSSTGGQSPGTGGGIDIPTGGFGGGVVLSCDTPGEPGTIYEHEAESLSINIVEPVPMCFYRDKVLLITNVAAL
jgi:hypothetical protein